MSDTEQSERYWNRFAGPDGKWCRHPVTRIVGPPPGEELAALRTGLSAPPGAAMRLWPFCVSPTNDALARRPG
ncbi:hypothetical protein LO772_29510 [Yinghuangia sp. ASG 101]|uniref:hypothetical protein n=1 Tax=Yinghuangia sp. ASG 101 TaxID=2896848 RepID=UPI001E6092EA|nr:hypothetical protein [Yinghuangia sp. ASG 101]UGQ10909.1 hypothetical protein LO772_29510 [Yinghuangia sp. ASG 101]